MYTENSCTTQSGVSRSTEWRGPPWSQVEGCATLEEALGLLTAAEALEGPNAGAEHGGAEHGGVLRLLAPMPARGPGLGTRAVGAERC